MLTTLLAAAAHGENPYGLQAALREGGIIAQATFGIMVLMLFFSLYILFTKLFEQQKILSQGKRVQETFWNAASLREGAAKLEQNSAYRQLVDDGIKAQDEHGRLTDPVEAHDWLHNSLARSQNEITSQLKNGLSFLATVGSTAPFIGLFGTVIGIIRALVKIGSSGQASLDMVAGPVGEALIMTAVGLAVAVPAVLAFNWLQARNKKIQEEMSAFANDVLGYLASNGAVRPTVKKVAPAAAKPAAAAAKPAAK